MRIAAAFPLILGFALCRFPMASWAALADCAAPTGQKMTVQVEAYPIQQDRSLSIARLSKRPIASRVKGLEGYDYALGLTEATLQARAQMQMLTTGDAARGYCSAITEAAITIEWRTIVRIASEIKPSTCIFDAVVTHEQKHVDLDRKLIPAARAGIEAALAGVAAHAVSAATVARSQAALQERASTAINTAIDAFSARRSHDQLRIDTPAEYDKVPQACGRAALNRLLGH